MSRTFTAVLCGVVVVIASCATLKRPDSEALKPVVEAFHRRVRFKDFRGAAELIVPERRDSFVDAREAANDERDLFFSDYELEEAKIDASMNLARAVSKLSWYRLPSTSEQHATVTSLFVWRQGTWLLESQEKGPFDDLKAAKVAAVPKADAGN